MVAGLSAKFVRRIVVRPVALLCTLLLGGCAPYYEFDQERANARLKPKMVPVERSSVWKTHDEIVDLFAKSENIPHHKDLAGHLLQPPRVRSPGQPVYPPDHIYWGLEGRVFVIVVISTEGKVIDSRVVQSANPRLNGAALATAGQWKFSPATIDGKPTNFIFAIPIDFKIRRKS